LGPQPPGDRQLDLRRLGRWPAQPTELLAIAFSDTPTVVAI
jgi:hypothetical protein